MNKIWTLIVIIVIAFFVLFRFLHLEADFPHHYTNYGVLYTDEGWYSKAATSFILTGDWYVEGDFNPAVILPIFPVFQFFSFKLFGIDLSSARMTNLIFLIFLLIGLYYLIKLYTKPRVALIALLILSLNFLFFVYSRLALLELPTTFFVILSILLISNPSKKLQTVTIVLAGIVYFLALFTKTTAIFALPILFYVIWNKRLSIHQKAIQVALFCIAFGVFTSIYYFMVIRAYWPDYLVFNSLNLSARFQTNPLLMFKGLARAVFYAKSADIILYPSALFYLTWLLVWEKQFRQHALLKISLIWMVAYLLMIGLFNYVPPRYYLPLVVPISVILAIAVDHLLSAGRRPILGAILVTAVAISLAMNSFRIIHYIQAPEYSWMAMVEDLQDQIASDGYKNPVLLGHFSNSITLATGISSINDRVGTENLDFKINRYNPNYYVCLGDIDSEILRVLSEYYHTEKMTEYNVYDNYYTGEPVVMYRLVRR